jgi:hypothetical protein
MKQFSKGDLFRLRNIVFYVRKITKKDLVLRPVSLKEPAKGGEDGKGGAEGRGKALSDQAEKDRG